MKKLLDLLPKDDFIEPEEIRDEYPKATEEQINYVMALISVKNSLSPWEDFHVFEKTVRALNLQVPRFDRIEGCLPEQIWYATKLMRSLWPKAQFSSEVLEYVKTMSNEYGFYMYPPELEFKEDDKLEKQIMDKAMSGPFPLGESFIERQAAQYLAVQLYLDNMQKKDFSWL